jgi:hypothetical protein
MAAADDASLLCGRPSKTATSLLPWLRDGAVVLWSSIAATLIMEADACDKELC